MSFQPTDWEQKAINALRGVEDPQAFMEEVKRLTRAKIKVCNKCGLCVACGVAIHLGWVRDPTVAAPHS